MLKILIIGSLIAFSPRQLELESGSLISKNDFDHSVQQLCATQLTKTLREVENDIGSNANSLLAEARALSLAKLKKHQISSKAYFTQYKSDTADVTKAIKLTAAIICPAKSSD